MSFWRFTQKISLIFAFILFLSCEAFADYQIKSEDIRVDTANFSGLFSLDTDTVQKALDIFDKFTESDPAWESAKSGYFKKDTDTLDDILSGTANIHFTPELKSNYDAAYKSGDSANFRTVVTGDHGTASVAQAVNVCYGTGNPPTASTTPEGTLYIKYTP